MTTAISVQGVSKKFRLFVDKTRTLKESVLFWRRNRFYELNALNNINLQIKRGSTVGIIGRNGSGKSTLLKLLSRIIYPDTGTIKINGKVSTLLELGAGFHPDFTGRENIYLNASILGLSRSEVEEQIDDIIAFAELEKFIDNPVRNYSTGMYMRLGFAVAINVDPDVLLVDEVLAVGDTAFQSKCQEKIDSFRARGKTIVLVTHDTSQAESMCDYLVWLDKGEILAEGEPHDVVGAYLDRLSKLEEDAALISHDKDEESRREQRAERVEKGDNVSECEGQHTDTELTVPEEKSDKMKAERWGNGVVEINSVKMFDVAGNEKYVFQCGETVQIAIWYEMKQEIKDLVFGIGIFRGDGLQCYGTNTYLDKFKQSNYPPKGVVKVTIYKLNLLHGKYFLDVAAHSQKGLPYDYLTRHWSFTVRSRIRDVGVARLDHAWKIEQVV
jgi:ABC-type polysaccharide/polyol phosphate transport system ATPase subunit